MTKAQLIIFSVNLSIYESEASHAETMRRLDDLRSFFDQFENFSFPIAHALRLHANLSALPTIYVITATNSRADTQLADLTRLRNTLWLVPKLVWILVEDAPRKTERVARLLQETRPMRCVHLNEPTSEDLIIRSSAERSWAKPRGVQQRNKALDWLRENVRGGGSGDGALNANGVVYFADDDNTYDVRLFEEMRHTKKVSVWPVAFVGELMYERPICKDEKVNTFFFQKVSGAAFQ